MNTEHARRPPAAAILLVPVAVALILTLFAWPSARMEPRDLPIGVAGPARAVAALEQKLGASGDAFEVHRYAGEQQAREAIRDREVYGAFVATRSGAQVLSSSAASPAVAQLLSHAATELGAPTTDVVSAPRAGALAASVLPLVVAGILTGVAAVFLGSGVLARVGLAAAGSILCGLVAAAIVQSWLGVVDGDWVASAAALSLTVAAIAFTVAGLHAVLGGWGILLAALTMIFVGNPFSGVGSAPELLPEPVGGIGQLLPPGAGGNLVRSTGYFDGAAAGGHVAVLLAWTLGGVALMALGGMRARRQAAAATPAAAA